MLLEKYVLLFFAFDFIDMRELNGLLNSNPVLKDKTSVDHLNNISWEIFIGPQNYSLSEKHLSEILRTYLIKPDSLQVSQHSNWNNTQIIVGIKSKKIIFNLTELLKTGLNLSHIQLSSIDLDQYIRIVTGTKQVDMAAIRGIFDSSMTLPEGLKDIVDEEFPSWHIAHKLAIFIWSLANYKRFRGSTPFNLTVKNKSSLAPFADIQNLLRTGQFSQEIIYNEPRVQDILMSLLLTACILSHAYNLGIKDNYNHLLRSQNEEELRKAVYRFESSYGKDYVKLRNDSNEKKQLIPVLGFLSFSEQLSFDELCPTFVSLKKAIYIVKASKLRDLIFIKRFSFKKSEEEALYDHNVNFLIQKILRNKESKETTHEGLDLTLFEVEVVRCVSKSDREDGLYRMFYKKFINEYYKIQEVIFFPLSIQSNILNYFNAEFPSRSTQLYLKTTYLYQHINRLKKEQNTNKAIDEKNDLADLPILSKNMLIYNPIHFGSLSFFSRLSCKINNSSRERIILNKSSLAENLEKKEKSFGEIKNQDLNERKVEESFSLQFF